MHRITINEQELFFLDLFRIALSAETLVARLEALLWVKHEVIAARLQNLSGKGPSGWERHPENQKLVQWVAATEVPLFS